MFLIEFLLDFLLLLVSLLLSLFIFFRLLFIYRHQMESIDAQSSDVTTDQ